MPDALAEICRDAGLSPRQAECFTLAGQGLHYHQIAKRLGIHPATVHGHLMQARRRVREREEERRNMAAVVEWSRERRAGG